MAQGLASNDTWNITEDQWGRIYVTTGRGLDRLDLTTGRIKHYTTADGLPHGVVGPAFRDRQGTLWFGTANGLARLVPEPEPPEPPPTVFIRGLRLAGAPHVVSELGEPEVSGLVLEPNQDSVQIDYLGLSVNPGEALHYQYRMEGTNEDWSAPTEQRAVHYARLSPGTYCFTVRAMNADGLPSPTPAVVAFTIRPPIWRRGWFLTVAAGALALLIYALYRYRLRQLLALERVRTRLATDLHDDIGSSLSGIAFLSEAVQQQIGPSRPEALATAAEVAALARGMAEAVSDVVWSIDPRQDDLGHLMTRLRQFAARLLEAQRIAWTLQNPSELDNVKLTPEQRRHLFLIGKEALNNIVRHAQCTTVRIAITRTREQLAVEIHDDGRGFLPRDTPGSPPAERQGNGLRNMEARATQLGGTLQIKSKPGRGTSLRLTLPLK
jgi:signal transduction histidine kinase